MATAISAQQGQAAARLRQGRQKSAPPLKVLNVQNYGEAGNKTSAASRLTSRRQAALRLPRQTVKAGKGKQAFQDAKQTTNARAGRKSAFRNAALQAKKRRQTGRVNKAINSSTSTLDPKEQVRIMLDRTFAGSIATLAGLPLALGLLIFRGLSSLKAAQSLPIRDFRYTETNWIKMLPSAKKMRPFTFTKNTGIAAAFAAMMVLLIIVILQMMPFLLIIGFVSGVAGAINPFN